MRSFRFACSPPSPPSQAAMLKMSQTMQKSGEVMKSMNKLMNMPQMQATMQMMSQEMAKAGLIEEVMGDAIDMAMDDDEMDEEAEEEVEKVVAELTMDIVGAMGDVSGLRNPAGQQQEEKEEVAAADDPAVAQMRARLAGI